MPRLEGAGNNHRIGEKSEGCREKTNGRLLRGQIRINSTAAMPTQSKDCANHAMRVASDELKRAKLAQKKRGGVYDLSRIAVRN